MNDLLPFRLRTPILSTGFFCTVSSTPILSTPISSTFAFQYIQHIAVRMEKMNDGRMHTTY